MADLIHIRVLWGRVGRPYFQDYCLELTSDDIILGCVDYVLVRLEMELPQPEFEAIKQELLDDLI